MTVIEEHQTTSTRAEGIRRLVLGTLFTMAGVAAGFALGQNIEFDSEPDRINEAGALVERSQAMQANIDAVVEGGRAQSAALAAAVGLYTGPLVERSLAMDRFYGAASGVYSGPLVERSLAMDRDIAVLIEGSRAQAASLLGGE